MMLVVGSLSVVAVGATRQMTYELVSSDAGSWQSRAELGTEMTVPQMLSINTLVPSG
jgi:hypothetical protein